MNEYDQLLRNLREDRTITSENWALQSLRLSNLCYDAAIVIEKLLQRQEANENNRRFRTTDGE